MNPDLLESRFAGALLGTMVGDMLGAPFEGQPHEMVAARLGTGTEDTAGWIRRSRYTDDTQMMIGVAESLVERDGFDGEDMARRFAENCEPFRGYGSGAHQVLAALRQGHPWDQAATLVFPDGSFGNGAAMRVAPVGAFYHHDLSELRRAAGGSASITHAHPLGKEGAALKACAVALALRTQRSGFDPVGFLGQLVSFVRPDADEFTRRLASTGRLLDAGPTVDHVVAELGNDIRAHGSVPAAIYAFLSHPDSFEHAVVYAVMLGGDTDTIGAMTGAIAGALHGIEAIPVEWYEGLENSAKGRDYVRTLSARLFDRHAAARTRGD